MRRDLSGALQARFVFVVGKGGVGKTTTAGALALALAEEGARTRLLSTDPAHSLADLFEVRLEGGTGSACSERLVLEEFDARAFADAWVREARDAFAELIQRGTLLDDEQGQRLLDLSLPGVDEVAAALRLADLAVADDERIVVDTAPTGHTLRLLDAGRWLEDWLRAFRAMADKAAAVAEALVRQRVPLAAEEHLDALARSVATFEAEVLRRADFVVVSRAGAVVEAETARLVRSLEERGLRVAVRVRTGGGANTDTETWAVPEMPGLRGCEPLRGWHAAVSRAAMDSPMEAPHLEVGGGPRDGARHEADEPAGAHGATGTPALGTTRYDTVFFAGKGGVGKTTCAAAYALALARTRPVTLLGVDPAGSLEDVLAMRRPADGVEVVPGLVVRQLEAAPDLARIADGWRDGADRLLERLGMGGEAALDRAVLDSIWSAAPPGVDEVAALLAILDARDAGRALVVDTAPTGHFLRLIELPALVLEWTHALLRLLVRFGAVLELDDSAQDVLRFAKRLRALRLSMEDPQRTAVFVVALDEPVVEAETRRLVERLEGRGMPPAARILNRAAQKATAAPGVIAAPAMPEPPVGAAALLAFADRWRWNS